MNFDFIRPRAGKKAKPHGRPGKLTREEIALSYNKSAISVGHLTRQIQEAKTRILGWEQQILEELKIMATAEVNGSQLPQEPKAEDAAAEGSAE